MLCLQIIKVSSFANMQFRKGLLNCRNNLIDCHHLRLRLDLAVQRARPGWSAGRDMRRLKIEHGGRGQKNGISADRHQPSRDDRGVLEIDLAGERGILAAAGEAAYRSAEKCGIDFRQRDVLNVIGREIEPIIKRLLTCAPQRFGVAKERVLLQGVVVDIDDSTGRALSVQRISEPLPAAPA